MGQETIDVVYIPVATVSGKTAYHGTYLYTNSSGQQFYAGGTPSNILDASASHNPANLVAAELSAMSGNVSTDPFGYLKTISGTVGDSQQIQYGAGWFDSSVAITQNLLSSTSSLGSAWATITGTMSQVDARRVPYGPATQNSNSALCTAGVSVGLDAPIILQGWGSGNAYGDHYIPGCGNIIVTPNTPYGIGSAFGSITSTQTIDASGNPAVVIAETRHDGTVISTVVASSSTNASYEVINDVQAAVVDISGSHAATSVNGERINVTPNSSAAIVGSNDIVYAGQNSVLTIENDNQNRVGIPERPASPTLDRVISASTGGQFILSGAGEVDVSASGAGITSLSGSADVISGTNNSVYLSSTAVALSDGASDTISGTGTVYANNGAVTMGYGNTNLYFKGNDEVVSAYQNDAAQFTGKANIFYGYGNNVSISSYGYGWGVEGSSLTVNGSNNITIGSDHVELTASGSNIVSNLDNLTDVSIFGSHDGISGTGFGDHLTIGGAYDYNYLNGSNVLWEGVPTGDYSYGSGSTSNTDPYPDVNPDNGGTPSFSELDPLVLNLAGGSVQTQNLASSSAYFDVQNIGIRDHTGWGTPGEGYLVYDPQSSNSVTNERSLVAGFSALKVLDGNNDGVLNPLDAAWASMKVWIDANGSGTFAAGSLMTMAQIGIASINVNSSHVGQLQNNNTILDDSRFTWNNGVTGDIAGVDFNFHADTVTTYEPPDPPDPPACVQVESILPSGVRAGDVKVGDVLELADENSLLPSKGVVTYSEKARSVGLRLRTEGGISLVCSHTAPIATLGGIVLAPLLLGKKIATRRGQESDGLITWETVIALEYLGEIEVQHITVGDRCFWAGESAHEYVLHHNRKYG